MKEYILSVVAAAVVCSIARGLLSTKTANGRIVGLLTGIFMTVTAVAPLANITFTGVADYINGLSYDADRYVSEGKLLAEIQTADIIKSQTEAYILDKADRIGLQITVEVELDDCNE